MNRSVLLLAGGRSRRLGQEKCAVRVGALTVLERMLEAVRGVDLGSEPDILVSVRDEDSFRERHAGWRGALDGVRLVEDERSDLGPVAGLAAGLTAARGDVVAVLGADMPFVTAAFVEALFAEIAGADDIDVVIPRVDGREQRLCAVYRSRLAAVARDLVGTASGPEQGPRVTDLLDRARVRVTSEVGVHDEAEMRVICRGIDTPPDLQWALTRVLAGGG
jgi:molybdopterin-guanine dinucleotide biosynthesis protein A